MKIRTISIAILLITYSYTLAFSAESKILLGVDVLIQKHFTDIAGKKVALLTNHAGRTNNSELTAEIFAQSDKFDLVSIFTPEHGFYTTTPAGEAVSNTTLFGKPVYSLYGSNRRPLKWQLSSCDVVVVDVQDIGVRSYTYISTVYNMIDACAEYGKQVIILDRPNPIGGLIVDGGTVEKGKESFIGIIPISYVHGCTIGELAMMINGEGWLPEGKDGKPRKCDLRVIKMIDWQRWMAWSDTGLQWFPTSPHIPTVDALRGAAMLGVFGELGTISIGIGTTLPFQYVGNQNFDIEKVKNDIPNLKYAGVDLHPIEYKPFYGKGSGNNLSGFLIKFPLDNSFRPYTTGFKIMLAIKRTHPEIFNRRWISDNAEQMFTKATGNGKLLDALVTGKSDFYVLSLANDGLEEFLEIRAKYLLYGP
jgi:uncharacterized protein YbbC (DUF1343 family)